MSRVLRALTLAVAVLAVMAPPVDAAGAAGRSPVSTVRAFLRALAAHDARGVCSTFSPELRAYVAKWEGDPRGSCHRSVQAAHFSSVSPGYGVRSIRIRRVVDVARDATGNWRVDMVLYWRFTCQGEASWIPGCRPHFEARRDVFFLRAEHRQWLLVKPGSIFDATDQLASPGAYDWSLPPGDTRSVNRVAAIRPSRMACPAGGTTVVSRHRTLLNDAGQPVAISHAPWLQIKAAQFVWVGQQSLCVTMTLGAPPRADSRYLVNLDQPQPDGSSLVDLFYLEIDGAGGVHTTLKDGADQYGRGRAACPTTAGLTQSTLTLVISPGSAFRRGAPYDVDADSESLQTGEPLLHHPIDATDTVPFFEGLHLSAAPPALPRCPST